MLMLKKKYYLFIENTREFNFNLIKIRKKFNIIYRNQNSKEKIDDLKNLEKIVRKAGIIFILLIILIY